MRLERDTYVPCVLKIHTRRIKTVLGEDIARWLFPEVSRSARCSSFLSTSANGQTAAAVTATKETKGGDGTRQLVDRFIILESGTRARNF